MLMITEGCTSPLYLSLKINNFLLDYAFEHNSFIPIYLNREQVNYNRNLKEK